MLVNIISVLVLVALVVLFAWLVRRSWGSKRAWLKWPGLVLSGLLTLVLAAVTIVAVIGFARGYLPASNPAASIKVAATSAQVERGKQMAYLCAGCHSPNGDLPLAGGQENFGQLGAGGPTVGNLYPPNLTPGGELASWTDGEIIRAIREGVHKSGRPLLVMPSATFHNMSDEDVQALVAYLRSQPTVKREAHFDTPSNGVNVLGALFLGSGLFPTSAQPAITQPVVAPPRGTSPEYGDYLVHTLGCTDCHGEKLDGHTTGGLGPSGAPNLTLIVPKWQEADLTTRICPDAYLTLTPDFRLKPTRWLRFVVAGFTILAIGVGVFYWVALHEGKQALTLELKAINHSESSTP